MMHVLTFPYESYSERDTGPNQNRHIPNFRAKLMSSTSQIMDVWKLRSPEVRSKAESVML